MEEAGLHPGLDIRLAALSERITALSIGNFRRFRG